MIETWLPSEIVGSVTDVTIIIVSYNVRDLLIQCLDSIHEAAQTHRYDVIVVDNASVDGSVDAVRQRFPLVSVIESPQNLGFGAALNRVSNLARGCYLLLLNPDAILGTAAIDRLVDTLDERSDAAIVGPRLRFPNGIVQSSRRRFPTPLTALVESTVIQQWRPGLRPLENYVVADMPDQFQEVDWLVGACLLVRRSVFQAVGGFDERFTMYSEELDLCRRIQGLGWKIVFDPRAEVVHYEGRSSERNQARRGQQFSESKSRFFEKYYGPRVGLALRVVLLANTVYLLAEEAVKMVLGHRVRLRQQRIAALGVVAHDQAIRLFQRVTGAPCEYSPVVQTEPESSSTAGRIRA